MEKAEPAQLPVQASPDEDSFAPFLNAPGVPETRDGLWGRVLGLAGGALCGVLAVVVAMVVLAGVLSVLLGPARLVFVGGLFAIFE